MDLVGPLRHGPLPVGDSDQRSLGRAIHRHDDRAPFGHVRNHRRRDPSDDLVGVDRQGEYIVHAGDELQPLSLPSLQFDEAVAFIDLTMSVVDVHRQAERTDHLTVIDENFADAFDPVDRPVRPHAAMVEPERCRIAHRVGDDRSDPVAVAFVDQLDPTVEGAHEPVLIQSEQRAQVAVPADVARLPVPRPFTQSTGGERGAEPICLSNGGNRVRDLTFVGRPGRGEPQTQTGGQQRCRDSHPVPSAAGDVVHPAEHHGRHDRNRTDHGGVPNASADHGHERHDDQQRDQNRVIAEPIDGDDQHADGQPGEDVTFQRSGSAASSPTTTASSTMRRQHKRRPGSPTGSLMGFSSWRSGTPLPWSMPPLPSARPPGPRRATGRTRSVGSGSWGRGSWRRSSASFPYESPWATRMKRPRVKVQLRGSPSNRSESSCSSL